MDRSTSTEQQPLRQVLLKIQDLLSNEDRERLHFLLGSHIPRQYREDPTLGGTLRVLETLLDREIINEADCHYLIQALRDISCFQAAKQLSGSSSSVSMEKHVGLFQIINKGSQRK